MCKAGCVNLKDGRAFQEQCYDLTAERDKLLEDSTESTQALEVSMAETETAENPDAEFERSER